MNLGDKVEDNEQKKKDGFTLWTYISTCRKYAKLGLYDKAITTYKAALKDYPESVQLLVDRAFFLLRLGKTSEARNDIEIALRLNPKNREVITLQGEVKYIVGDFERGYIAFHKAHVDHPNLDPPRLRMENCKFAINNALDPQTLHIDPIDDLLLADQYKKEGGKRIGRLNKCSKRFRDDIRFVKLVLSDNRMNLVHTQCKDLLRYLKERDELSRMESPNRSKEMLKCFSVDSLESSTDTSKSSWTEGSDPSSESFSNSSPFSVSETARESKEEWKSPIGSSSESDFSLRLTCQGIVLKRFRFRYRDRSETSISQESSEPVGDQCLSSSENGEGDEDLAMTGTEKKPADELSCGDSISLTNILSHSRISNRFNQHCQ